MSPRALHVVLPNDIDDPSAPSGGNVYDRRICGGLADLGWLVREHPVHGAWPAPDRTARAACADVVAGIPDGAPVLVDGLVASAVPDVLGPHAGRLHLVILVHMPLGGDAEAGALAAARAVVTTSEWTARRLTSLYGLAAGRVHVARPGVDKAPLTHGSASGGRLLSVAALTANKGPDVLAAALAGIADQPFTCGFVGSLTRDPEFAAAIRDRIGADGLAGRVRFTGPVGRAGLAAAYGAADLLVLASYGETYGMVVTEALARGIPVLATDTGGLPEALGRAPDGTVPGLLVEPGDPVALAAALRRWLGDPALRQRLRLSARGRRELLTGWDVTAGLVAGVLQGVAA